MDKINTLIDKYVATHAPTQQWSAPSCGWSEIKIARDGRWYHQGAEINRQSLVALFASVLTYESGRYWLKTPAETCEVEVESHPFVIQQWHYCDEAEALGLAPCILAEDNLNRLWPICAAFPLKVQSQGQSQIPYLELNYGLSAVIARNVYYQWAELLQQDDQGFYLDSAKARFYLG